MDKEIVPGDTVTLKKVHACGENQWKVIRIGMDFKIKCENCGRLIMMSRRDFEKKFKGIQK